MSKIAFIPLYWDDFEADTVDLGDDLAHKYLRLLWHCYQRGGALPADDLLIARLAGIERTRGWRGQTAKIRRFFVESSGFLYHKRVRAELEKSGLGKVVSISDSPRHESCNSNSIPIPRKNSRNRGGEDKSHEVRSLLTNEDVDAARALYPGYDMDFVEMKFNAHNRGRVSEIGNMRTCWLGFVRKHAERNKWAS